MYCKDSHFRSCYINYETRAQIKCNTFPIKDKINENLTPLLPPNFNDCVNLSLSQADG